MAAPKKTASKPAAPQAPKGDSARVSFDEVSRLVEMVHAKGFEEFELEQGAFRLRIVSQRAAAPQVVNYAPPMPMMAAAPMMPAPMAHAAPAGAPPAAPAAAAEPAGTQIKSPMVGTFYRSPAPNAPAFVQVGDKVHENSVLCIIEAMKLMNEIKAEMKGVVRKVCVENGQPVEYGQLLYIVEPE
ncbi:MAG: acetyl-CoA carboxylase biotin carboxyl carrier protein [Candidatus Sumerlaeia bacterium]|nr:acetyl-CoA carboxylase biotin carboxyl carrier protein [Candidatus Sumerlaeia bacterium]